MEFKKLSDVEVVAEPTESANVLIEENGVIKKAPKTAVGGAGLVLCYDEGNNTATVSDNFYNILKERLIDNFVGVNLTIWFKYSGLRPCVAYQVDSVEDFGNGAARIVASGYYFDINQDGVYDFGRFD